MSKNLRSIPVSPYVFPGLNLTDRKANLNKVLEIVSEVYSVSPNDLASDRRFRELVDARKTFCYAAKRGTIATLKSIGNNIGGRDHTTVRHSIIEFENLYVQNDEFHDIAKVVLDRLNITFQTATCKKYRKDVKRK